MTDVLTVKNLRKSFGNFIAVKDVSFNISKGEIFGLLGPNGAGKTTTINLITGTLGIDSGEIDILGKKLNTNKEVFNSIGICTQHLQLWPLLTCEEQMCFMGSIYKMERSKINKRANELLEVIGLKDKRKTIAKKLSGGMQRRLHVVMSIIHDPDLVIFDEPEAGLDPQSRILVRDFIKDMAGSKTVLLTTHNMDEAERLSSRVAIMDKGTILQNDTPANLRLKISPEETLEVVFNKKVSEQLKLKNSQNYKISVKDNNLYITGLNLTKNIQELLESVTSQMGNPVTFSIRQSTLEDVFIKLTGRSLRE